MLRSRKVWTRRGSNLASPLRIHAGRYPHDYYGHSVPVSLVTAQASLPCDRKSETGSPVAVCARGIGSGRFPSEFPPIEGLRTGWSGCQARTQLFTEVNFANMEAHW